MTPRSIMKGSDMTARLTIDQVRVGMRVICVDDHGWLEHLRTGETYTITSMNGRYLRFVEGKGGWPVEWFTAAVLSAMTPELVEWARKWHADATSYTTHFAFRRAIERAGILAPPAPRTTDMQPTLQEGWWS